MSQFGMQMPAGQMQRGASMNVYTGLLLLAVVALLAAIGFVVVQGSLIGAKGEAWSVHTYNETSKSYTIDFGDKK